jgi:hypothetical protein
LKKAATACEYLHVEGFDNVGNSTYDYYEFKKDDIEPDATVDTENQSFTSNNITINITASDTGGSGVSLVKYIATESTNEPDDSEYLSTTSTDFNYTISTEGSYILHIKVYDNAGNYKYKTYGAYFIDKTSPSVTYNHASGGYKSGNNVYAGNG